VIALVLGMSGAFSSLSGSTLFSSTVSKEVTAQNAVNFISANYLSPGVSARLDRVTEESGVYKLAIEYSSSQGKQVSSVYLTRDGKLLFPNAYSLTATTSAATTKKTVEESCSEQSKVETPVLEVFVASYCPYGTQIQDVLAEVVSGVPDLAKNIRVRYMGGVTNGTVWSMHGPTEAAENLKQICIREEQPDAYWKYVSCFLNSSSSTECVTTAGIDLTKLTRCTADPARGITYAEEDFAREESYGVTGSPTLFLNGVKVSEFNFGGRNPEAVKTLICCGFSDQPGSCATRLSNVSASASQGSC
jgi:hypothetical protein